MEWPSLFRSVFRIFIRNKPYAASVKKFSVRRRIPLAEFTRMFLAITHYTDAVDRLILIALYSDSFSSWVCCQLISLGVNFIDTFKCTNIDLLTRILQSLWWKPILCRFIKLAIIYNWWHNTVLVPAILVWISNLYTSPFFASSV